MSGAGVPRLRRFGRHLVSTYLAIDPRTLGLFRILFGALLLYVLVGRFRVLDVFYTDAGLLPGSTMRYLGSPFLQAATRGQALLGMSICTVVFAGFLAGYKTRVFQVLTFFCLVSLNTRIGFLENGGDFVMNLLALWTMFLPLGRRFSIDALRSKAPPDTRPVVSLAVLGLLLQLAVIYAYNYLNKVGVTWHGGSAIHYVLHQARMVTAFGVWFRDVMPYSVLQAMTWGTLAIEAAVVPLILSPVWTRFTRFAVIAMLSMLHLGIHVTLTIANFSLAMVCFALLLLTHEHWTWMSALWCRIAGAVRPTLTAVPPVRHPAATVWTAVAIGAREAFALLLIASFFTAPALSVRFPEWLHFQRPTPLSRIVTRARLLQDWRMFAPGAPTAERFVVVDAVTADGRTVDPLMEVATPYARLPFEGAEHENQWFHDDDLPDRLDMSRLFAAYSLVITQRRFEGYLPAFSDWILRYHERTGRPEDRIVSFRAYRIRVATPPPETDGEPRMKRELLVEYPPRPPR